VSQSEGLQNKSSLNFGKSGFGRVDELNMLCAVRKLVGILDQPKTRLWKLIAYNPGDPARSEFHGFEFTSNSWEGASKIFSELSGEYGHPVDGDYDMELSIKRAN